MSDSYRLCTQCVMDTTVPDIRFDEHGVCNHCHQYRRRVATELHDTPAGRASLEAQVEQMKREGHGRDYDCLIGVSGGVDSTYVAYLVKKEHGLRPLAVHLDNGWDSELAVANVERTLKRLQIDLYTRVLDWEEFRDLQISFLRSSISNAEIPTDHAIWATLARTAGAKGIRYLVSGSNIVTESVMPESWLYGSKDARIINAIHRQFGRVPLSTFPQLNTFDFVKYFLLKRIRWVPILNYVTFVKADAKRLLMDELGWRDYGGKHYESVYTRFFHAYYLPRKFGIDLRRSYLSALILSGQMTQAQALAELECPPAPPEQLEEDRVFVIKKLGLTEAEFNAIMEDRPRSYAEYPNSSGLWDRLAPLVSAIRQRVIRVGS